MEVFGRELTTEEIIRFVRDFAAQTRHHKDCHDCLYIDMALALADALESDRRAAQENDYAALKAQYDEINRYNISCTKKIDELLAEKLDTDAHLKAISDSLSEQLRRPAPENKPLTFDELRKMDGEPVFVASPGAEEYGHWVIVAGVDDTDGDKTLYCNGDFTCRDYGKTWLAYARRPEAAP